MHFRHRQTDRQTDTDIVAYARDVREMYILHLTLKKVMSSREKGREVTVGTGWKRTLDVLEPHNVWADSRQFCAATCQLINPHIASQLIAKLIVN